LTVAWGVLGASSSIAQRSLLPAMAASPNVRLAALASRSSIPDSFGADRTYGSYEQLLADADV
jgi:predicted dehydrogenase